MSTPSESQILCTPAKPARQWQFTLTSLFMLIALVAILLPLLQAEGCGRTYTRIGSLQFSSNGDRLAVAKYNAHDANVPLKTCLTDVSRTISIVSVETGKAERVVEQTIKRGNQGPGFRIFGYVGNCIAFGSDDDTLFVADYSGTAINQYDLTSGESRQVIACADTDIRSFQLSHSGTVAAIGCPPGIELWGVKSGKRTRRIVTPDIPFMRAPLVAISCDDRVVATGGSSGVRLWNLDDGSAHGKLSWLTASEDLQSMAYSPANDRLAVGFEKELRVYEAGKLKFSRL